MNQFCIIDIDRTKVLESEMIMANNNRNKPSDTRDDRRVEQQIPTGSQNDQQREDVYRSTDLRDSKMMAHLLDAMEAGEDIGEYGRLTFVMVARHFMTEDEMLKLLIRQPEVEEKDARRMILQVKERDYSPPKRERILQWQERQDFQICPDADDPNNCNVYRELQFPDHVYAEINEFWEEKAEAEE